MTDYLWWYAQKSALLYIWKTRTFCNKKFCWCKENSLSGKKATEKVSFGLFFWCGRIFGKTLILCYLGMSLSVSILSDKYEEWKCREMWEKNIMYVNWKEFIIHRWEIVWILDINQIEILPFIFWVVLHTFPYDFVNPESESVACYKACQSSEEVSPIFFCVDTFYRYPNDISIL